MHKSIFLSVTATLCSLLAAAQANQEYSTWVKKGFALYEAKQYKESAFYNLGRIADMTGYSNLVHP